MKDVFIILPDGFYDPSNEDIARMKRAISATAPNINPIILPPGTKVVEGKSPYYAKETLGDYSMEIGFQTLAELEGYLQAKGNTPNPTVVIQPNKFFEDLRGDNNLADIAGLLREAAK